MLDAIQFALLAAVLLPVLCQCSGVASDDDATTEEALQRLREAVTRHDVEGVERVLHDKSLRKQVIRRVPPPLYWVANERVDSEKLARIAQLLLDHFGESNYDYNRYHPLTRAVHRHLTRVVDTLLNWPGTIKEVHADYLLCEDLDSLPDSLRVIITPDSSKCFQDFHRAVKFERSELAAAARLHRQREQRTQKFVTGEFDWSNPFLTPPPGKRPSTKYLVMNPHAFTDFSEAVVYYFLGEWAPVYTVIFCIIVILFWCLTCGVFIAAARR